MHMGQTVVSLLQAQRKLQVSLKLKVSLAVEQGLTPTLEAHDSSSYTSALHIEFSQKWSIPMVDLAILALNAGITIPIKGTPPLEIVDRHLGMLLKNIFALVGPPTVT